MNLERIVVVGEGPSDLEVIPVLVRRLVEAAGRPKVESMPTYRMKDFKVRTFQKKVLAILNQEPAAPVVIVVDRDRDEDRLATLQAGRALAGDPSRCVIGLAVEMLEAWLLADRKAWKTVFPWARTIPLPDKPEQSWGKAESPNHPKQLLQAALRACKVEDPRVTLPSLIRLAEEIDLGHLAEICPEGFGALATEIRERWLAG